MPQRLTRLRVPRVSFVDRAAVRDPAHPSEPRRFVFTKSEGLPTPRKGATVLTDAQKSELDPAVRELIEKSEQETADAKAALAKAEEELEKAAANSSNDDGGGKGKDGEKSDGQHGSPEDSTPKDRLNKDELPPAVAAVLEKAEAREREADERIRKADEKAASAEKIAKAEQDKRVTGEYIAKSETGELRGLPGAPADVGPLMKSLAEAAPEQWAEFEKAVLVPSAEQIRKGELFKEAGVGGEGPPPESALAKFEEKVTELRKADPQINRTDAMERVRRENRDLEKAMARELRGEEAIASTQRARGGE